MGTHLKKTLNFFSCSSPRLSSVFSLHASFSRFEDDVWIEIAKYLDGRSMVMLATTCKWFYKTLSAECVWKYASLRDLAVPDPGDVSFSWKKLYASAFDGSHSCLFRQQEKHIDACCMIDRRMGIYGYPIEIQSLFFFALRCAKNMLKEVPDNKELLDKINSKIKALSYHIQTYYWFDYTQLNNIYRYKTEEYSHTALNKFNVSPESIPDWLFEFMPLRNGYFIGNVSPARMDFRWFLLGNCISILSSLATPKQASAILDLIEARWDELVGEMPLKISYPALEGYDRNIITGFDSKNTRWSYHNGGSWPVLLWLLVSACIKTARPQMVGNAIKLVEKHLSNDGWPEYYDGKTGRYIGKQARISQFEDDVWIEIAKYLDGRSLVMLATTCRWFYKTLSEECMWKYACLCDLAVPDPGDVSFNWKNLYASAFDGSHSYLFCQQEKHIDWIWIGAVFLESSAAIVTEKLTSPPRKISQKETLEQILQSRGLCVLTNIKTGIWIADLQLVRCSVCDLNTCDGTMQTLDARHFELFMNESDQDGSWDYTQISSHEAKKQVDGASGAILDLKHLKDASSTEIFKAKSWIGKQNDWQPKAKLTLHAVCGVESLALPCKFLADGSHSYLFHQQEKRIGSSVAIVTEKLTSPPWKIHLKETLVQMLQSRGLCVLTNIKFHAVMSSLESVGSTDYRGDRDEGSGDDDGGGDDGGGGDDDDNGEEGQGESQGEEEGSINGPEGDKRDEVVDVYWRLNKDDENIIWITNLNFHHCCYSLGGKKALFDHVRLKVAEVRHQAVTKDYKIVLETRTDKNREFSEMFTKYHEISRNLHRVIICPDPEITPPILLTC